MQKKIESKTYFRFRTHDHLIQVTNQQKECEMSGTIIS